MKVKKIIKKLLYKLLRNYFIKSDILPIGKISEREDCFVCLVEQNKINEYLEKTLSLFMNNIREDESILKCYKLDKPVVYVFENIDFSKCINIECFNSKTIFKKCKFNNDVHISYANDLIFENNSYHYFAPIYDNQSLYIRAHKLTFINENFINDVESLYNNRFGMDIKATKVVIVNSYIDTKNIGQVCIESNDTIIKNSEICSPEVFIKSKNIKFKHSKIKTSKEIKIEGECDTIKQVEFDSPRVILNNEELKSDIQEIIKHLENIKFLFLKRYEMIEAETKRLFEEHKQKIIELYKSK